MIRERWNRSRKLLALFISFIAIYRPYILIELRHVLHLVRAFLFFFLLSTQPMIMLSRYYLTVAYQIHAKDSGLMGLCAWVQCPLQHPALAHQFTLWALSVDPSCCIIAPPVTENLVLKVCVILRSCRKHSGHATCAKVGVPWQRFRIETWKTLWIVLCSGRFGRYATLPIFSVTWNRPKIRFANFWEWPLRTDCWRYGTNLTNVQSPTSKETSFAMFISLVFHPMLGTQQVVF